MGSTTPLRHVLVVAGLWALTTLVGLAAVLTLPLLPGAASREAAVIDNAFLVLLAVSVPVFALVEVVVVYSALRFRGGSDGADGPPIRGNRALAVGWVAVTLVMVLALATFGWIGLNELHAARPADLHVKVIGSQFAWRFEYPGYGFGTAELRLPKDRLVHLEVTSKDVLHSFWVPSFRVKQDAVPGRSIAVTVTPTELGRFNAPCAELCGLGHTIMQAPVQVLEPAAFEAWAAEQKKAAAAVR